MKARFTVTGPGVDRKAGSAALGLSAATTYANRATRAGDEATFYVRDAAGKCVGRADADGAGGVVIYGERQIDRAPSGPPSLAASRSAVGQRRPRRAGEQTFKANARQTRVASEAPPPSPTTKEDSVTTTEQKKGTTAKPESGGEDLAAALIAAVKERVPDLESKTNASGMTRLLIGSKAFAYLEKARATGQPVKIPKPLMAIEESLPSGAGFHATKWGLTRTISRKADVAKVAHALSIAAAAVSTPVEEAAAS